MKIPTKGRFALRALIDLTINSKSSHVSLINISERQGIPINHLEQIFQILKKAGIVKSIKGNQGGYKLADNPSNIKVGQVIELIDGEFQIINDDIYDDDYDSIRLAIKSLVWDKINNNVKIYLNQATSLEDLSFDYKKINGIENDMYYI